MITIYKTHNTLIHRELLPPPVASATYNNVEATASYGTSIHALLHKVYTYCSRVFLFLLIALSFVFASCEKQTESFAEMKQYYAESCNLLTVQADSVKRFSSKVEAFVIKHPTAKDDYLYTKIQYNINDAFYHLSLDFGTWQEDSIGDISERLER